MAGPKQMVPGFNHNVKHRGKPYHVQTEDSGLANSRIVTHLFLGGNVLASKKTSYVELRGAENLLQVVRELMEDQHKGMLRNLVSGVYDEETSSSSARAYQPGELAAQSPGGAPVPVPGPGPDLAGYIALKMNVGKPVAGAAGRVAPPLPAAVPSAQAAIAQADPGALLGPGETQLLPSEDLVSERSLDQLILSYLAEGDSK
jgi:hypothetical protein